MRWRVLIAVGAATLGAGLGYGALYRFRAPGGLTRAVDVVVPRGHMAAIAGVLAKAGVIEDQRAFRLAALATAAAGPMRAAELRFPAHVSLSGVLDILRRGAPVQHFLTVPEGLTSAQISVLLARADGLDGDIEIPPEGSVLPETYAFERGMQVSKVVTRGQEAMRHVLDQAWATRARGLPVRNVAALLVIASLVERETHVPAERPMVAAVFYNRLRLGMRLQTDPAVIYAESGGFGTLPAGLSRAGLMRDTPYNTYVVPGLPVGPICAPGASAIEAAAHPASSSALYFVADGSGGHVFASSLAEHVRNVERYRSLVH